MKGRLLNAKMQTGRFTVTDRNENITFSRPFKAPPTIFAYPTSFNAVQTFAYNITATGATIGFAGSTLPTGATIDWIAMERT